MTIEIILLVLFLQLLTIYLDNKTNMHDFFFRLNQGTVATAYTNRGITLTVSRTLFFGVPPFLGYLILNSTQQIIENLIILIVVLNFIITLVQGYFYYKVFKKNLIIDMIQRRSKYYELDFCIGVLAFMFFLITPYLLNYLALVFPSHGLWIVQLNPIFNSFLTLYVIWIYEPRVAKKIDKQSEYDDDFFEAIQVRILGRLIILILIIIFFILF